MENALRILEYGSSIMVYKVIQATTPHHKKLAPFERKSMFYWLWLVPESSLLFSCSLLWTELPSHRVVAYNYHYCLCLVLFLS